MEGNIDLSCNIFTLVRIMRIVQIDMFFVIHTKDSLRKNPVLIHCLFCVWSVYKLQLFSATHIMNILLHIYQIIAHLYIVYFGNSKMLLFSCKYDIYFITDNCSRIRAMQNDIPTFNCFHQMITKHMLFQVGKICEVFNLNTRY